MFFFCFFSLQSNTSLHVWCILVEGERKMCFLKTAKCEGSGRFILHTSEGLTEKFRLLFSFLSCFYRSGY